ncbi:Myoblast growth factor receptor egl-15 [Holothuria leucospilota]|uniref:Myoblast growth factor receptor egl-15 n=1 Tax=Holothuria leucospilota TaxID=206669 RepID=A0A9Q1HAD2_HOLLE|nr:Myoblast growth factor receptor egl-15 [Holothuria leucospilota]
MECNFLLTLLVSVSILMPITTETTDASSFLDFSYTVELECAFPDVFVNQSTIREGLPLIQKNGSEWKLQYHITWEPIVEGEVHFQYKVGIGEEKSTRLWNSHQCEDYGSIAEAVTVPNSYYFVEVSFTSKLAFQVLPAVDGRTASDTLAHKKFETPDCYNKTRDATFCSQQDVLYCGAPINLTLINVTYFTDNRTNVPVFEWYAPVQVNSARIIVMYDATIRLAIDQKDHLQSKQVRHSENVTRYMWTANGSGKDDLRLENSTLYVLKVTPYVLADGELVQGRTGQLYFWSTPSVFATALPKPSPGPTRLPLEHNPNSLMVNLLVTFLVVVIVALVIIAIAKRKGLFKKEEEEEVFYRLDRAKTSNEYTELLQRVDPVLKPKEISHDKVTLQEELGKGQFGIVYKGLVFGLNGLQDNVEAAVKTTKDGAFDDVKEDLLDEMKLMIQLGSHPNLMTLLACCTQREPYFLITEFMQYGDLLNFLRKCRERENWEKDNIYNLGEMEQLGIGHQIAKGMAYVQDQRFYHGDLAARNVLVGRGLTVKISDFGLADDIYSRGYKRREQEQKIPIKWCSIEAILNGICSSEGDVWSYGVVLYEVFTLGGTPYPGIAGRLLVAQLKEGFRMEQPEGCPDDIYNVMLQCWQEDPMSRPRFQTIVESIDAMLVERSDYLCFEMEDEECEDECDSEGNGSSRPLSVPNIYVRAPGSQSDNNDNFAPIMEEDNEVGLTELQEIIHSVSGKGKDVDSNCNVEV